MDRDDKDREPDPWNRRESLLGAAARTAVAASARGLAKPSAAHLPAIDTHIHLFDSTRPQGAHYKGPKRFTSHVLLPAGYRALASPLGNVGAIAVEASHWLEEHLWLLSPAQTDEIMVGAAGYLQPEKPEFAEYLEPCRKNPLVREYFAASRCRSPRSISGRIPCTVTNGIRRSISQKKLALKTHRKRS